MMIYLLLCEQSNILIIKEPLPQAEVPNTFNNPHNKKAHRKVGFFTILIFVQ
jgi:hypothetical protein